MDVFGAEKYLMVQGFTYYGNIYCHKDNPVTVGFLKEEKLHLLPFYDLYTLKSELEKRYVDHFSKTKEKMEKTFKKVIREIDNETEKLFTK